MVYFYIKMSFKYCCQFAAKILIILKYFNGQKWYHHYKAGQIDRILWFGSHYVSIIPLF